VKIRNDISYSVPQLCVQFPIVLH